ncbi:MAG: MOSC domain-containing protein [Pseudomonadota bacterium]
MITFTGRIEALCIGQEGTLGKEAVAALMFVTDGIEADRHAGFTRDTWDKGDKQPPGIIRRNERQWSAVSSEELEQISQDMRLTERLTAADVGANLEISGVPHFSCLTKGSLLALEDGGTLVVEEYNPPCQEMGERLAARYARADGKPLKAGDFLRAAKRSRGVVGVVDVAGDARVGDPVTITLYAPPEAMRHPALVERIASQRKKNRKVSA